MSREATDLLGAAGRAPNTAAIGPDAAGVQGDARGCSVVNDRRKTTAPAIWATCAYAGGPQVTHASFDDVRIVRDNLAGGPWL